MQVAALLTMSAYLKRFPSVESMVRAVVPGADRKLRLCVRVARVDERVAALHTPPGICSGIPPEPLKDDQEDRNSLGRVTNTGGSSNDIRDLLPPIPSPPASRDPPRKQQYSKRPFNRHVRSSTLFINHPKKRSQFPNCHTATLVIPEHDRCRYNTIIHQGLLGVAEGSSSSGSSSYSTHSLPRCFDKSSSPQAT